jgi:hypothetical protein
MPLYLFRYFARYPADLDRSVPSNYPELLALQCPSCPESVSAPAVQDFLLFPKKYASAEYIREWAKRLGNVPPPSPVPFRVFEDVVPLQHAPICPFISAPIFHPPNPPLLPCYRQTSLEEAAAAAPTLPLPPPPHPPPSQCPKSSDSRRSEILPSFPPAPPLLAPPPPHPPPPATSQPPSYPPPPPSFRQFFRSTQTSDALRSLDLSSSSGSLSFPSLPIIPPHVPPPPPPSILHQSPAAPGSSFRAVALTYPPPPPPPPPQFVSLVPGAQSFAVRESISALSPCPRPPPPPPPSFRNSNLTMVSSGTGSLVLGSLSIPAQFHANDISGLQVDPLLQISPHCVSCIGLRHFSEFCSYCRRRSDKYKLHIDGYCTFGTEEPCCDCDFLERCSVV